MTQTKVQIRPTAAPAIKRDLRTGQGALAAAPVKLVETDSDRDTDETASTSTPSSSDDDDDQSEDEDEEDEDEEGALAIDPRTRTYRSLPPGWTMRDLAQHQVRWLGLSPRMRSSLTLSPFPGRRAQGLPAVAQSQRRHHEDPQARVSSSSSSARLQLLTPSTSSTAPSASSTPATTSSTSSRPRTRPSTRSSTTSSACTSSSARVRRPSSYPLLRAPQLTCSSLADKCETCGHGFSKPEHLKRHKKSKTPCSKKTVSQLNKGFSTVGPEHTSAQGKGDKGKKRKERDGNSAGVRSYERASKKARE